MILAFDIEHTDFPDPAKGVIAIGGVVKDAQTGRCLNIFKFPMYIQNVHSFSKRCWNEFWKGKEDVLEQIKASPKLLNDCPIDKTPIEHIEYQAIFAFTNWCREWEALARVQGKTFTRVTDNKLADPVRLNALIRKYLPPEHPVFPYSFTNPAEYGKLWETNSMARGYLLANGIPDENKVGHLIREIHGLPKVSNVPYDHVPWNDAAYIADSYIQLLRVAVLRESKLAELEAKLGRETLEPYEGLLEHIDPRRKKRKT